MAKTRATLAGALVALFASLTASLLVWLRDPEDSWLPNLLENLLEGSFLLLSVLGLAVVASLVVVASLGLVAITPTARPSRPPPSTDPRPLPLDQYRMAVEVV